MDREVLEDLFRPFGPVQIRRMFGGLGVFADGMMFGLVAYGELYMKSEPDTEALFEAEGSEPFVYAREGRAPVKMGYYKLPENAYEDSEEFLEWANLAFASARKAAAEKARKQSRSGSKSGARKLVAGHSVGNKKPA